MRSLLITVAAAALAAACANAPQEAPISSYYARYSSEQQDYVPAFKDKRLERFTASQMEKFGSEYEFLQYVRDVKREVERRGDWWAGLGVQYAQVGPPAVPVPCDPKKEDCPEDKKDRVVVTGSAIAATAEFASALSVTTLSAPNGSITNNQNVGVDEGDIVKLIGRFLVVLQDGRLFSVDLLPDGQPGMKLADRRNVYDKPDDDGWYDEMLVTGDRILITSYSYEEDGTKLSVFRIDDNGRMTGEGAFVISSNDYYSVDNYATRMVGDKLVIYSPVYLRAIDPDEPVPWPMVRRWTKNSERAEKEGTPLFDARGIYKPMQPTLNPVIHTVSVCDLGTASAEAGLPCRSSAITGPPESVFYVSPTDAYLWAPSTDDWWADRCMKGDRQIADGIPGGLYRLPLSGARVKMMNVKGAPQDQFAIDTSTDEIRSLVVWGATGCDEWGDEGATQLKYFSASLSQFRDDIRTPSSRHYTVVPEPGGESFENRFTGDHVVYGAKGEPWYWSYAPDANEPPQEGQVVAVPLKRPLEAKVLKAPHGVMRAERVGNNAVLTGYRDNKGLSLSFVDLSGEPRIAATEVLEGRYESEGRSHAFNSRVDEGGGGMLGIPTVKREGDSGRWWWRSRMSDVSFLTFDRTGTMFEAGELTGRENSEDPSYKCEVSCIDWYGNSRPFFIAGRIFALSGTEMVEGSLAEGQVLEVRRVNLTTPVRSGAK